MSDDVIETVADAVRATRELEAALESRGDIEGALCLCKATGAYYTTASEALIGMLEALRSVSTRSELTRREREQLMSIESSILELLDLR